MQVSIHKIIVENRIREDLGDLEQLMASLQKHGQLNPIVIDEDGKLIAGHRRLESAKKLGWLTVETICLKDLTPAEKLELEIDENIARKELSQQELQNGYDRLETLNKPSVCKRLGQFFKKQWGRIFKKSDKKA